MMIGAQCGGETGFLAEVAGRGPWYRSWSVMGPGRKVSGVGAVGQHECIKKSVKR
jgi:hypothetical protein